MNRTNKPSRRSFFKSSIIALGASALDTPLKALNPNVDLKTHKLAKVETRNIHLRWPRHVGKNATRGDHGHGTEIRVVILKTDQGASGWGIVRGREQHLATAQDYAVGKPLSDLFDPASGYLDPILFPFDVAFYDLAGVILDAPVWQLLGGQQPAPTPIYSGMIYFDDLNPPEAPAGIDKILEQCQWDYEYGYRQFKVKIGRGGKWMDPAAGLQRDVEVVQRINERFPSCDILVDANDEMTVSTATRFLKELGSIPLFWFEEPFRESIEHWTALHHWIRSNRQPVRYLADGEYRPDLDVLVPLEEQGILNVRLSDITWIGFSKWCQLMLELRNRGTQASPHAWGDFPKSVYIAHVAAAFGNVPTVEGITCTTDAIDFGDNQIHHGYIYPSDRPGFGMQLDKL